MFEFVRVCTKEWAGESFAQNDIHSKNNSVLYLVDINCSYFWYTPLDFVSLCSQSASCHLLLQNCAAMALSYSQIAPPQLCSATAVQIGMVHLPGIEVYCRQRQLYPCCMTAPLVTVIAPVKQCADTVHKLLTKQRPPSCYGYTSTTFPPLQAYTAVHCDVSHGSEPRHMSLSPSTATDWFSCA